MQFYTDSYNKVENHPDKQELINNKFTDFAIEKQREEVLNELLYYQAFIEAYNKAKDVNTSKAFYIELRDLNKNIFNNPININDCIAEPKPQSNFYNHQNVSLEKLKFDHDKKSKEIKVMQPVIERKFYYDDSENDKNKKEIKEIKPVIDPNKEKRHQVESKQVEKIKNENKRLAKSLYTLEEQKRRLEEKVKDLEQQTNRSQFKNGNIRPSSSLNKDYKNEGFQQVLRSKEEQLQMLQMKIDGLEKENQKIAEKDIAHEPSSYRTPITKSKVRSKILNSYLKTSEKVNEPPMYSGRKYDNTGSEFVDQMYNNINKLLDKSSYKQMTRERSYAY